MKPWWKVLLGLGCDTSSPARKCSTTDLTVGTVRFCSVGALQNGWESSRPISGAKLLARGLDARPPIEQYELFDFVRREQLENSWKFSRLIARYDTN